MDCKKLTANPVGVVLQMAGGKWKLLIIKELLVKELRFVEIRKKVGCTAKILTACLREMEADGLIVREASSINSVNRVEYYLTDIGYTLKPVIDAMQKWGKDYKRLKKLMEKYENENNISGT